MATKICPSVSAALKIVAFVQHSNVLFANKGGKIIKGLQSDLRLFQAIQLLHRGSITYKRSAFRTLPMQSVIQ